LLLKFQVGVSEIFCALPWRIIHRGGGLDGGDYIGQGSGSSCATFCNERMQVNALDAAAYCPNPFYLKCYDALSFGPLNGIRIAFSSQVGTTLIDSGLPQMTPYNNVSACMRMHDNFFGFCFFDWFIRKFYISFYTLSISDSLLF